MAEQSWQIDIRRAIQRIEKLRARFALLRELNIKSVNCKRATRFNFLPTGADSTNWRKSCAKGLCGTSGRRS
jgi:hypothetical protein